MTAPAAPRRSKSIRIAALAVGAVMLLLVVLLVTRKNSEDRETESVVVGKVAPGLAGDAIFGKKLDIGTNDRWLVVNFFATWCAPCEAEHPELRSFSSEHAKDGLARVVSIVYDDKAADVKAFFKRNGGNWTVLDDPDGQTSLDYGVAKIPESFLVAPTGIVVRRFSGGVTMDALDQTIAAYEKAGASASGSDATTETTS